MEGFLLEGFWSGGILVSKDFGQEGFWSARILVSRDFFGQEGFWPRRMLVGGKREYLKSDQIILIK